MIAESASFQEARALHKDRIDVCRSCELRYACSDCRAYLERPEDSLSKPLKCGYDPETGIWSDWARSPAKSAAIAYYQLDEATEPSRSERDDARCDDLL